MLGDYGEVYVLDWGIAKILTAPQQPGAEARLLDLSEEGVHAAPVEKPLTGLHHVLGTRAYASPEQASGANDIVDSRTDVFSLGAILFEILTWQRLRPTPTPKGNIAEAETGPKRGSEPRTSLRAPALTIAPELENICVRATQPDRAARYPSVRALLDDLESSLSVERTAELRAQLASQHAHAAEAAANEAMLGGAGAEQARQVAIREAGRAVGIDSQSALALGTLQRLISRPPQQLPNLVEQALARSLKMRERTRLRGLAGASLALLLLAVLLPLCHVVRDFPRLLLLGTTAVASTGLWMLLAIRPRAPRSLHYLAHGINLILYALIGRIVGPLWLMTLPLAMNTFLQSATPDSRFRRFVIGSSCVLLLAMVGLEIFEVLTPSYSFADGALTIRSPLIDLTAVPLLAMLTIGSLLVITVPALSIGQITTRLAKAERQLRLRAWHLAQILPEEAQPMSPSSVASIDSTAPQKPEPPPLS